MKFLLKILLVMCLLPTSHAIEITTREAIVASIATLLVWNPMALEGVGLDYATDEEFTRARLLWLWEMDNPLKTLGPLELQGHFELGMGQTMPNKPDVNIGITPIIEWHISNLAWAPFIETGFGANLFSKDKNRDRDFSSHFMFGEILGVAIKHKNVQAGLRFQHHSNANIALPNNGYNFYGIALKFWY